MYKEYGHKDIQEVAEELIQHFLPLAHCSIFIDGEDEIIIDNLSEKKNAILCAIKLSDQLILALSNIYANIKLNNNIPILENRCIFVDEIEFWVNIKNYLAKK